MSLKVIHLISGGDVGGAKTHVLSLLRSLGNDTVSLICFKDGEFAQDARALGINTRIFSDGMTKTVRDIARIIKSENIDVVHCHGSRANFVGSLLKSKVKVPFVTTVHSDYKLDYMGRPLARMTYGVLNSVALRRMDYYIGVSDAMAELLIARSFPPDRVYTIYNGIDFGIEPHPLERAEFFGKFGINAESSWVIAGIGARLNPVKDMKTLIRAAAEASADCPELHVAIAGDGEELSMLQALAKELGIADKVHFLGWVDDMFSFYNSIDINTLTSLSETFPYALTDGARFSLPAISSKVGGVAKLIIDGKCGYLFTPGDFGALASHLRTLCRDKELRTEMGKNFERRARELFSLENTRDTQLEIYGSIIRRSALERSGERAGVTICGAYGQKNSGDDAILESIVHSFRSFDRDIPIRVMTRTPKATAKAYRVKTMFTFNPLQYRRAMRASKLFLGGGGSLIQNVTSRRSLWFYLHAIKSAKKLGCSVMMYGCGIGPVNGVKDRRKAAETLNRYVDTITLREDRSLAELRSLEVTKPKIVLSADPALKLPCPQGAEADAVMRAAGLDENGGYIGFSLRRWSGFAQKAAIIAAAADYAFEKYGLTPVFISFNNTLDTQASETVVQRMKTPGIILSSLDVSSDIVALLSHMRALVSMRLHGLIFASGQGVPLIGIAYDPKVSAFLHYINQGDGLDFDALDEKQLKDAIDNALSTDNSAQSLLVSRLTELESLNISCARELL